MCGCCEAGWGDHPRQPASDVGQTWHIPYLVQLCASLSFSFFTYKWSRKTSKVVKDLDDQVHGRTESVGGL